MKWPRAMLMKLHQLRKLLEIVLFICSQGFVTKDREYTHTAGPTAVTSFTEKMYESMLY